MYIAWLRPVMTEELLLCKNPGYKNARELRSATLNTLWQCVQHLNEISSPSDPSYEYF